MPPAPDFGARPVSESKSSILRALGDVGLNTAAAVLLSQVVAIAAVLGLAGSELGEALGLPGGSTELEIDAERPVLEAIAAELEPRFGPVEVLDDPRGLRLPGGRAFEGIAAARDAADERSLRIARFTLESPLASLSSALTSGDPARTLRVLAILALPLPLVLAGLGGLQRRRLLRDRESPADAGNPWLIGLGMGLLALGLTLALDLALRDLGLEPREQPILVELIEQGGAAWIGLFLFAVVLAPLGEELFFRGYVFERLQGSTPDWLAFGLSAALFAGAHFNPSAIPIYLMLGLVLAWTLRSAGTVIAPIVAHAVYNGTALLVAILGAAGDPTLDPPASERSPATVETSE